MELVEQLVCDELSILQEVDSTWVEPLEIKKVEWDSNSVRLNIMCEE